MHTSSSPVPCTPAARWVPAIAGPLVDAWRGQAASEEPDGVSTAETPPTGRPKTESDAEELTVITSGATTNGESPPPVGDGPIKPK